MPARLGTEKGGTAGEDSRGEGNLFTRIKE